MFTDRKWVKFQDVGNIKTTLFTADPGDYSRYDYDDTVNTGCFNEECGDCKDTHVAHDLRPDSESTRHRRSGSLHVNLTPQEVKQYADQVRDMTIADVHLSLFGWWIKESDENFKEAKKHLRELGVDSVSCARHRS
jgi:ABC-type Zn2+ transport system substrate-binding protein/surface adhesin